MTLVAVLWGTWMAVAGAADETLAGPADALLPPVRALYLDGRAQEAQGQLDRAAARYRRVHELEPSWTQALLDLGRVYEAQDQPRLAELTYQKAPNDSDIVEAYARLLAADDPRRAAELYRRLRQLRPETPEFLIPEARATASFDPGRADQILRDYLERADPSASVDDVVEVATTIAQGLAIAQEQEQARALLDAVVLAVSEREDALATTEASRAFAALRERFVILEEARALAAASDVPLIPYQQAQLRLAREAFATGDAESAETLLRVILSETPHSAETWAALSDILEQRGDIAGAEVAVRMAEGLSPLVAAYPARLGDLLAAHYGGRYDADAAAAYARALQRPGASPELWYRKGELLLRAGVPDQAVAAFERYLSFEASGGLAERARQHVAGWGRRRPSPPDLPKAPGRPATVPAEAWDAYHIAHVLAIRAEDDPDLLRVALDELAPARALAPSWPRALNLEASLRRALGDEEGGREAYTLSLAMEADQPDVLVELAALERRAGNPAAADHHLGEAARLGSAAALLHLARQDVATWRLWSARDHLHRYFESATSGVAYDDAVMLERVVVHRLRAIAAWFGAGVLLAVGVPLGMRWRRRSGEPLEALLRASPGAWRDVARIASAIRHEILKHHTTVLSSVADALDERDPEPARWAAEKLYGPNGALARFRGYVEDLRTLGAVHGLRLNLRYRDPVLGPLIEAMEDLAGLEPELRTGGGRRLADSLRDLSLVLNRTGYRGLGALIRRVCLLEVDEALLEDIWASVRREQAHRATDFHFQVDIPDARVWVRIYRGDLHDILANLMRNAALAGAEVGSPRVRVAVQGEEDVVTGLERVAIRVADDGPRRISTAMIRGRHIGRGLGLAVDLVSRNGGSVHVEDEPGWTKAVVVRLPRAEWEAEGEEEVG